MRTDTGSFARAALALAVLLASTACGDSETSPGVRPQVTTNQGPVVGQSDGTVASFLGIPYAAPPVGDLRWRPPIEHAAWTEPLDAAAFGPACPQGADIMGQTVTYSEDCLTLNVWSPDPAPSAGLPVMVFIHGGGFRNGASSKALYDGRNLAADGRVVIVSMNYRLGKLGFLAHPDLTAEDEHQSSGNYGLLDQQAALRWVQANIAAFGGDPSNVTLFGESAGAMSICDHLASPLAAGLFRRAIVESGSCMYHTTPLRAPAGSTRKSAESLGETFAHAIGCDTAPDLLACLRAKSVEEVLETPIDSEEAFGPGGVMLQPNIDGYVLPSAPAAAFVAGNVNALEAFVGGVNRDEATIFTAKKTIVTVAEYEEAVRALLPEHVDDVVAMYSPDDPAYPTVKDAYNAFITDFVFLCPTRAQVRLLASRGVKSHLYFFTKLTERGKALELGVYHGSELPYVFGNLSGTSNRSEDDQALSELMMGYWTRFGAVGDPNGGTAAAWPMYSRDVEEYLEIGDPSVAGVGLHAQQCDAIGQWLAHP